jgi:hypothetical protein
MTRIVFLTAMKGNTMKQIATFPLLISFALGLAPLSLATRWVS